MKIRNAGKLPALLLSAAMIFTLPLTANAAGETAAQKAPPAFVDLAETDELYPYARYLACQEIMGGFPDGTFKPEAALTRAEAANIAAAAKKLPPVSGGTTFSDVPAEHWANSCIEAAAGAGLIKGYPDGTFGPDKQITKAEAASLLLRLSGGGLSDGIMDIADIKDGHWAYKQTVTALEAGFMTLSSDRLFRPDTAMTRGEFAKSLSLLFTLGPDLRAAGLIGNLTVTKGSAAVTDENGNTVSITGAASVGAGMTIATDEKSRAEISFDDGSGISMEPGMEISIVRADGFRYMKADGTPAAAIDKLEIKMAEGKLFGALANRNEGAELSDDQPVITDQNWWLYPYSQRERVIIEMPESVTGIFGTFWSNLVSAQGGSTTSVLTGNAEVSSGGEEVPLVGGRYSTALPSASGTSNPPSPPAPLTPSQMNDFTSMGGWLENRAGEIQTNAPTPSPSVLSPGQVPSGQAPSAPPAPGQPSVVSVVQGALNQISAVSPATPSGSTPAPASDDSGPSNSAPIITGPDTILLLSGGDGADREYTFGGYPAPTADISSNHDNTAGATFSGTTLSIPEGLNMDYSPYSVTLEAVNSSGTTTKTVTVYVLMMDPGVLGVAEGSIETESLLVYGGGDSEVFTLSLQDDAPGWVTLSGNTLTASPPLETVSGGSSEDFTFGIVITDSHGSAVTASFMITVNVE